MHYVYLVFGPLTALPLDSAFIGVGQQVIGDDKGGKQQAGARRKEKKGGGMRKECSTAV